MDVQTRTVILADDHPVTRLGMRTFINSLPAFQIIGEADDGEATLNLIATLLPDVAILDIYMPTVSGISVAKQIMQSKWNIKVILISNHLDEVVFEQGIALGVGGILLKNNALEEIGACLAQVSAGHFYVSQLCYQYLSVCEKGNPGTDCTPAAHEVLTATEKSIMRLIAQRKTTREIADLLHNSYKTIEKHRYNICRKLHIEGSCSLLSYAMQYKNWLEK